MNPFRKSHAAADDDAHAFAPAHGGRPAGQTSLRALDDADLMASLARGEDRALDELIHRYGARVRTYLGQIVRDPSWAEDLTQETFVRIYERAGSYDPQWAVTAWLFRIARNLGLDLLRRENVRQRVMDELRAGGAAGEETHDAVALQETRTTPLHSLESAEIHDEIHAALAALPEIFRSAFILREVHGLSYEEIGQVLDTSPKTVSSRLHRARQQLQKLLAGYLSR